MDDRPAYPEDMALEILRWYKMMGVDEAIADQPQDWAHHVGELPIAALAQPVRRQTPQASAPPQPAMPQTAARATPSGPVDAVAIAARDLARNAPDLEALEAALASFDGCPLKKTAKNLCFARGRPDARLMLIGEAPGRDEDLEGRPFVGRAGQLLEKMLAAIGIDSADAYITNVVYWRPPGNRTPTPLEVMTCTPFMQRQIELVSPEVLVLLGGAAAKQVLATEQGIMKLRGKWRDYEVAGKTIRTIATLHPAFLLRNPVSKRLAWRDLLMIKAALSQ